MISFSFKFIILLELLNIFFSYLCSDIKTLDAFDNITINTPMKIELKSKNEYCFKYKFKENTNKNIISLTFLNGNYTGRVIIYKLIDNIEKNENNEFINYVENYLIENNKFKEINVIDFYDYAFIVITDLNNNFYDNLILYDSESNILLEEGQPLNIKNFMSNNKYILSFSSEKNITIVYSTKIKGKKLINIDINGVNDKSIYDNNDIIFKYKNNSLFNNFTITIINENMGENQEFSIIFYENIEEYKVLPNNDNIKINYLPTINSISKQNFYFFFDLNYNHNNFFTTINFKLDSKNKYNKYIDININTIKSNKTINRNLLKNHEFKENEIKYEYELNSDEYLNYYIGIKKEDYCKKKYFLIKIEISNINNYDYFESLFFYISYLMDHEKLNVYGYYFIKANLNSKENIPYYYELEFGPLYYKRYILKIPYDPNILVIKGKLLKENGEINKEYINNSSDIIGIYQPIELTIRVSGTGDHFFQVMSREYDSKFFHFIDEKIKNENAFNITLNNSDIQYYRIFFNYDINLYSEGKNSIQKYWTTDEDVDINVWYKNNTDTTKGISDFFSTESKDILEKETIFLSNSNVELFTVCISKPVTLYIRPVKKNFFRKNS